MTTEAELRAAVDRCLEAPDDLDEARRLHELAEAADHETLHAALAGASPPEPRPAPGLGQALGQPMPEDFERVPTPETNWGGNIDMSGASRVLRPRSVDEVVAIVSNVLASEPGDPARKTVRAIGVSHSSSDLLKSAGTLIDTGALYPRDPEPDNELRAITELEPSLYHLDEAGRGRHVRVGAGARVREVNEYLDARGRALINTGAYTNQTLVGAFCTATHGSGVQHGPLHTVVRSIDLVATEDGRPKRFRVEPEGGITDRDAFEAAHPEVRLIQEDDVFRAVVVGLGAMGIITSVVVEVTGAFHLQRDRVRDTWADVRARLADTDADGYPKYFANTHTNEVLINPYPWPLLPRGDNHAVISRAWVVDEEPASPDPPHQPGSMPLLMDIARLLGNGTALTPLLIDLALRQQPVTKTEYGPCHLMLASSGDLPHGHSCEWAFSLDGYLPALDAILEAMYELARDERAMLSGPVVVRFVGGDDAFLSMAEGGPRVFVECLTIEGIERAPRVFAKIEEVALAHGGRAHWGQIFDRSNVAALRARYPGLPKWKRVRQRLDPLGLFENELTKELRA